MATQGIISIMKNNRVFIKIICGCDGYNAKKLVDTIKNNKLENIQDIYNAAIKDKFGCKDCLVVMNTDNIFFEGDGDIGQLYREKFDDPSFNPRWENGTADYVIIVNESDIII